MLIAIFIKVEITLTYTIFTIYFVGGEE